MRAVSQGRIAVLRFPKREELTVNPEEIFRSRRMAVLLRRCFPPPQSYDSQRVSYVISMFDSPDYISLHNSPPCALLLLLTRPRDSPAHPVWFSDEFS